MDEALDRETVLLLLLLVFFLNPNIAPKRDLIRRLSIGRSLISHLFIISSELNGAAILRLIVSPVSTLCVTMMISLPQYGGGSCQIPSIRYCSYGTPTLHMMMRRRSR